MTFHPDRIYEVVHPVPTVYIPRGGRRPRHAFTRNTTSVRIRHAAAEAFRPTIEIDEKQGFLLPSPRTACHTFEGGIWTEIENARLWRMDPLRGVSPRSTRRLCPTSS